jgi:hypothetical protein
MVSAKCFSSTCVDGAYNGKLQLHTYRIPRELKT